MATQKESFELYFTSPYKMNTISYCEIEFHGSCKGLRDQGPQSAHLPPDGIKPSSAGKNFATVQISCHVVHVLFRSRIPHGCHLSLQGVQVRETLSNLLHFPNDTGLADLSYVSTKNKFTISCEYRQLLTFLC